MTLRRQILLVLLLFGLVPLVAVVFLNMPMVISQLERFYHEAHLQNLRADFRDIDQHIASRNETVRLLGKLPEPALLASRKNKNDSALEAERDRYLAWLDRVLSDQLDITHILFLDANGLPLWRLERDRSSGYWIENKQPYEPVNTDFITNSLNLLPGRSIAGPIHHQQTAAGADNLFLRLTSPVYEVEFKPPVGAVVINIDVGGLAHAYRQTYWVFNNGEYLQDAKPSESSQNAFDDYPGLKEVFTKTKAALWNPRNTDPVIWIPMFPTSTGDPLWVGRKVDPSPLTAFRKQFTLRMLAIVAALVLAVLFIARLIAKKIEKYQLELTDTLQRTLSGEEMVKVRVRGPGELKNMAATLNQLAEKHANTNHELRKHANELETSNRYKSQFLANVSHELRTPLNSVLLLSKMLTDDEHPPLTQEQRQQSSVIHKAGTDLKNMIDNILDLSRIEARRCRIVVEPVVLRQHLEQIKEIVEPQFTAKHLKLALSIDDKTPQGIVTDGEKVAQIIKNFLSNALKFTPTGEVKIHLSHSPENAEQPILICVSDPGKGIPENQQTHIFEAFQQADGATNRMHGGTGLGLTISRELARLLGGKISLQSAAGQGATFCLHLPTEIEAQGEPALLVEEQLPETIDLGDNPPPPAPAAIQPQDYQDHHVLIIDSDYKAMLSLTALLENRGFSVTGALDQAEAMENLAEEHYDIIINGAPYPVESIREWTMPSANATDQTAIVSMGEKTDGDAPTLDLIKPVDRQQISQMLENHLRKGN